MPPNLAPEAPDSRQAVAAIVRRALDMTPAERRRLGRWTSASLRDPRISRGLEAARDKALAVLDEDPARRKRWDRASRPLHDELVASTREARRWRIWMLVSHLAALLAIVNVPNGLPPLVALVITLTAPISAWMAWGNGIAWLGAVHAALADSVEDRLEPDEVGTPPAGLAERDRGRSARVAAAPRGGQRPRTECPARRRPLRRRSDLVSMTRLRALIGRFLPEGALILSVLTFGYFAMGQLRNRVLANDVRAGTELDIYYAAFRIPEVALDVLVAAGLTAPFVPIFSSLRRGGRAGRERLRPDHRSRPPCS